MLLMADGSLILDSRFWRIDSGLPPAAFCLAATGYRLLMPATASTACSISLSPIIR
jgi:hypothetical protein